VSAKLSFISAVMSYPRTHRLVASEVAIAVRQASMIFQLSVSAGGNSWRNGSSTVTFLLGFAMTERETVVFAQTSQEENRFEAL
jgi:hypothetical protein